MLADVFDVLVGGIRQIFHEQMEIVEQIIGGDQRPGKRLRPIASDAERTVFIGVRLLRIDFADEPFGRGYLL